MLFRMASDRGVPLGKRETLGGAAKRRIPSVRRRQCVTADLVDFGDAGGLDLRVGATQ